MEEHTHACKCPGFSEHSQRRDLRKVAAPMHIEGPTQDPQQGCGLSRCPQSRSQQPKRQRNMPSSNLQTLAWSLPRLTAAVCCPAPRARSPAHCTHHWWGCDQGITWLQPVSVGSWYILQAIRPAHISPRHTSPKAEHAYCKCWYAILAVNVPQVPPSLAYGCVDILAPTDPYLLTRQNCEGCTPSADKTPEKPEVSLQPSMLLSGQPQVLNKNLE